MSEQYEIEEVISEGEKRFELYRKTISLFLGPIVFLTILFPPMPFLSIEAHRLSAVLGIVLIYWVGEAIPIPVTAILGAILCVILGVANSQTVFAPFAHPIIFLFIGSFMLAESMKTHKLDYRIALSILSLPWVGNSYYRAFFAIAIIPAFTLWILPGIVAAIFGTESNIYKLLDAHIHEEVVSLIAVLILFLTPVDWKNRKFTITWSEAVKIDWGTIILFGGGLSFGGLMFSTKLADFMGNILLKITGVDTLWGITAVAIGLAIITTEVTSNTATANMLVPLMISVANTAGVSGIPPAIGVCLGASMAFMLPVSTPSNAIVYGSGRVPITSMIRAGIVLDIISFFVILIGLRILCPILGLM